MGSAAAWLTGDSEDWRLCGGKSTSPVPTGLRSRTPWNLATQDVRLDGVDSRPRPEDDASFDLVVFDPPSTSTGDPQTSGLDDWWDRYRTG